MNDERTAAGEGKPSLWQAEPFGWVAHHVEAAWGRVRAWPGLRTVWLWGMAAGLVLRIVFLCLMPITTADLTHRLVFGQAVVEHGLGVVRASPEEINAAWAWIIFQKLPYAYPVVSLLAFWAMAKVWGSLFFGKLVLTVCEAVNARLIYKITGRRLYATLYWLAPASIVWVSREGQFEPLQNVFTLLALLLMLRGRLPWAWAALMLAIQVKVTPIFFAPWFVTETARQLRGRGETLRGGGWLAAWIRVAGGAAAGLLPTALTSFTVPLLYLMWRYSGTVPHNPYYFNFFFNSYVDRYDWTVPYNQIYIYTLLVICLVAVRRARDRWAWAGPLLMLLFLMLHTNVMPWYTLVWCPLLIPIRDARLRTFLFVIYPLFEVWSLKIMVCPYNVGIITAEKFLNLGVFDVVR